MMPTSAAGDADYLSFIHELPGWLTCVGGSQVVYRHLAAVRYRQVRLLGRMKGLGFELQTEASLTTLTVCAFR